MSLLFSKVSSLIKNRSNPHSYLGLQGDGSIFQFSPNKKENSILIRGKQQQMELVDSRGYFVFKAEPSISVLDYQIIHSDGTIGYDPYSLSPSVSLVDIYLFDQGKHVEVYNFLGSKICTHDGFIGTCFTLYAPNALEVNLIADLGNWREQIYPMRKIFDFGIFELFIPGVLKSIMYRYLITSKDYKDFYYTDPFARNYELSPNSASIIQKSKEFVWSDQKFLKKRKNQLNSSPINIYQLHLGKWCKSNCLTNYKEIALDLALYVKEMGYTHVHLLDEKLNDQPLFCFSPNSRYGTDEDFKYFVNHLHVNEIGIILDFPLINSLKKQCIEENHFKCILISTALFWIKQMHIDGFKIVEEDYFEDLKGAIKNEDESIHIIGKLIPNLFRYLSYSKEQKILSHLELLNSYKEAFKENSLLDFANKFLKDQENFYANLRLIYSVALTHPGKKTSFMGHESGQIEDSKEKYSWRKVPLTDHARLKLKKFTRDMNLLYKSQKPLYEIDFDPKGFCWIDHSDAFHQVISFLRKSKDEKLLIIHNFSKQTLNHYLVAIPGVIEIQEIMNTDHIKYGGEGIINSCIEIEPEKRGIYLNLPMLATIICKVSLEKTTYI